MNARLRSVCSNAFLTLVIVLATLAAPAVAGPPAVVNVPADAATIQLGIDAVAAGGEVIVAPGTYCEVIDFGGKAITLRSTDPEDPAVVATTVIDGTGLGASVVTCTTGEDADTVMSGLTITGGEGTPCSIGLCGGGMFNVQTSPTVTHCVFQDNRLGPTSVTVGGAGMYNQEASPTVTDCVFRRNAVRGTESTTALGGAVHNAALSTPTFRGCLFLANSVGAENFTSGAAMYSRQGSMAVLVNCTVTENFRVGALGDAALANFTFPSPVYLNCIVWSNPGGDVSNLGGLLTVLYTLVTDGWPGDGNIAGDPMFIRPADPGRDGAWGTADDDEGDLRLRSGSSCIDAGYNAAVPADVTTDLGGDPRFVDDAMTIDTGLGRPPVVDMGAYEYQACPADFDGNGSVGFSDLTQLLDAWGPCGGCPEDLANNGAVGFADLTILLAMWGDCPDTTGSPV